jgi:4'-phosphopantetheinyl transferase
VKVASVQPSLLDGTLAPGHAHVWYVRPELVEEPCLIRAYEALLDANEHARRARFRFPEGRHEYLVTRVLVRVSLSRYASVGAARWSFAARGSGRPEVTGPAAALPLRFSVSHTRGLIACLVTVGDDAGVDVEDTSRARGLMEVAQGHFAEREVAELRALDPAGQRIRFFEYWTLKEAYAKARGLSLSMCLQEVSFAVAPGGIRARFGHAVGDDPDRWSFALFRPDPEHVIATCTSRGRVAHATVEVKETLPLVRDGVPVGTAIPDPAAALGMPRG